MLEIDFTNTKQQWLDGLIIKCKRLLMIKPLCDANINAMELDGDGSLFVFFKKKTLTT